MCSGHDPASKAVERFLETVERGIDDLSHSFSGFLEKFTEYMSKEITPFLISPYSGKNDFVKGRIHENNHQQPSREIKGNFDRARNCRFYSE
jgi:hypothetical protein